MMFPSTLVKFNEKADLASFLRESMMQVRYNSGLNPEHQAYLFCSATAASIVLVQDS